MTIADFHAFLNHADAWWETPASYALRLALYVGGLVVVLVYLAVETWKKRKAPKRKVPGGWVG